MLRFISFRRAWIAVVILSTAWLLPPSSCRGAVFLGDGVNDLFAEDLLPNDDIADVVGSPGVLALIGDIESDLNPRESRYFWGYNLDASAQSSIAASDIVSLDLTLDFIDNPIPGTSLDIYALPGRADTFGQVGDYNGGILVVDNAFISTDAPGTSRSFDITAFAQANAGNGALAFVARMDGITLPNLNGLNNFFGLRTPEAATPPTLTSSLFPVAGEIDIFADVNETRNIEDLNPNDDVADNVSGTGGFLLPGDIESDFNPREIRTTIGFDLDLVAQAAINTPGAQVVLAVQAFHNSDDPLLQLDVYGLDGKTNTVGVLGDYTGGTLVADTLFDGPGDSGSQKLVDITAFALANAANGALTFRFQADGITLPNLDGNNDIYAIKEPDGGGLASFEPLLRIILPAVTLPGDFNEDGVVDAADYTVWRDNLNSATTLPNDDGLGTPVDQSHYDLWVANFGNASPGAGASVPEPNAGLLSLICLMTISLWHQRSWAGAPARARLKHGR